MKRDARLREGLIYALHRQAKTEPPELLMKLAGEILDRWDELVDKEQKLSNLREVVLPAFVAERDELQAKLIEHHAVGVLEGALIGDSCPICSPHE